MMLAVGSKDIGESKILNHAAAGLNIGTTPVNGADSLTKADIYLYNHPSYGATLPGSQYRLQEQNANNSSGGPEGDGYGEWSDDYDSGITNLLNANGLLNIRHTPPVHFNDLTNPNPKAIEYVYGGMVYCYNITSATFGRTHIYLYNKHNSGNYINFTVNGTSTFIDYNAHENF